MTQTNPKSHRRGGAAAENVQGDEQEWDRKQHFPPIQPLKVKCKVRQQCINTAIRQKKTDNRGSVLPPIAFKLSSAFFFDFP